MSRPRTSPWTRPGSAELPRGNLSERLHLGVGGAAGLEACDRDFRLRGGGPGRPPAKVAGSAAWRTPGRGSRRRSEEPGRGPRTAGGGAGSTGRPSPSPRAPALGLLGGARSLVFPPRSPAAPPQPARGRGAPHGYALGVPRGGRGEGRGEEGTQTLGVGLLPPPVREGLCGAGAGAGDAGARGGPWTRRRSCQRGEVWRAAGGGVAVPNGLLHSSSAFPGCRRK